MYEVLLAPEALCVYERVDPPLARRINRCFDNLARDPHRHPNIKRLTGVLSGRWRYRVGDWRVVYRVEEGSREVVVLVIAHRGSVYR
jgi:mRNA interferase RelE/StbE